MVTTADETNLHDTVVPQLRAGLTTLSHLLDVAEAHEKKATGNAAAAASTLLQARIQSDMLPLAFQIHMVTEIILKLALRACNISPPPSTIATYASLVSFADARNRVHDASTTLDKLGRAELAAAAGVVVHVPVGASAEPRSMTVRQYVYAWSLPNFYFHLVTAYDILRKEHVAIGKADYLGAFLNTILD